MKISIITIILRNKKNSGCKLNITQHGISSVSVIDLRLIFWVFPDRVCFYLTFSCRWIQILWNMVSFVLPAISAFISMATCLGNTDSKSLSCNQRNKYIYIYIMCLIFYIYIAFISFKLQTIQYSKSSSILKVYIPYKQ